MTADDPWVSEVMKRLEQDLRDAFLPHLITVTDDRMIELRSMFAGSADWLSRIVLDRAQQAGEITGYEYESVLDPFTATLHAHVSMTLPPQLDYIIVNLRGPDDS